MLITDYYSGLNNASKPQSPSSKPYGDISHDNTLAVHSTLHIVQYRSV